MRDLTGRRRTERRLAVQYAATRSLAESATLREATRRILQAIGETLDCLVGAIWTVDRARQELRCVEQWHARSASVRAFEAMSRRIALAKGEGLPGRVWADGEPVWIPDVVDDPNFPRIATARREGLHAGFAFPIRLGGEVLGVVEFFSREIEQPDHELLQMTEAVGTAIRIPCINRRAARREGHGLCRPSVVLQRPQHRVGVVQIASACEVAAVIAAEVVAI